MTKKKTLPFNLPQQSWLKSCWEQCWATADLVNITGILRKMRENHTNALGKCASRAISRSGLSFSLTRLLGVFQIVILMVWCHLKKMSSWIFWPLKRSGRDRQLDLTCNRDGGCYIRLGSVPMFFSEALLAQYPNALICSISGLREISTFA